MTFQHHLFSRNWKFANFSSFTRPLLYLYSRVIFEIDFSLTMTENIMETSIVDLQFSFNFAGRLRTNLKTMYRKVTLAHKILLLSSMLMARIAIISSIPTCVCLWFDMKIFYCIILAQKLRAKTGTMICPDHWCSSRISDLSYFMVG